MDTQKWTDFVYNHPHGNIFQTPEMFEVYNKTKHYEPVFVSTTDENENLTGILLAVIQKEGSGLKGVLTSRSIIWGGPLVKNNDPQFLGRILKDYNQIIKNKAIYSQFRNLWDHTDLIDTFKENNYLYEDHLDILNNLRLPEEELWNKLSRDKKKCINRAINDLVIKDISTDYDSFMESYRLIKAGYKRISLPIPVQSLFQNMFGYFAKKNNLKTFGVFLSEKMIGVRIVLCYKELIYDWYAGADEKYLRYRPNDILPWEVMKWGSLNGYKVFDFGGAGIPNVPYGVRDYKLKFGGELVNFGRFENIHKPLLMKIGKFGLKFYKKINELRTKYKI